jgi:hypothetical protein
VKAAQDEASSAAFRLKTTEAKGLLLTEREGALRLHHTKAHHAGRALAIAAKMRTSSWNAHQRVLLVTFGNFG